MVLKLTNAYTTQPRYTNHNMNYLDTLSPPSSSGDSSDTLMNSLGQIIYNDAILLDDNVLANQLMPYIEIIEQPVDKFRFRYKSEMTGTHGTLIGQNADKLRKATFPTVQVSELKTNIIIAEVLIGSAGDDIVFIPQMKLIPSNPDLPFVLKRVQSSVKLALAITINKSPRQKKDQKLFLKNYSGPAMIRCALYQVDNLNPHPHRLVSKDIRDDEKDEPHEILVSEDNNYIAQFSGIGIIHTAKKNLPNELYNKLRKIAFHEILLRGENRTLTKAEEAKLREAVMQESKNVNLNIVRLGFEAFRIENNKLTKICGPYFSQAINNLKSAQTGELKIVRMDFVTTSCRGGQEIFMLVEKVVKNNIKIRFFEADENDVETWEAYGRFNQSDVHHQYAIVFKAPPYKRQDIEDTVQVLVELIRPSDGARSEPKPFKYKPCERVGRKRPRINQSDSLSSSELPATINLSNMSLTESDYPFQKTLDNFFEMAENIDSDDFNKICSKHLPDYVTLLDCFNTTDAPDKPSTSQERSTFVSDKTVMLAKMVVQQLGTLVKKKEDPEKLKSYVVELFHNKRTEEGYTALHTSIICEQFDLLQYILVLLSKMMDLKIPDIKNYEGETALHLAVQLNDNVQKVISLLLAVGANPTLVNKLGNTPLYLAVEENNLLECKELINADTVNKENYAGDTPLFIAVQKKNLEYVKLLMKHKPDINLIHRKSGNTCLHVAIEQECTEIVSYLLSLPEIRVDIANYKGFTSVAYARNFVKDDSTPKNIEIYDKLNKFVADKGLDIKEEIEEYSSEEEMEVKLEVESDKEEEHIKPEYPCIEFPNKLINLLAKELDNTETLEKLIRDLNYPRFEGQVTTKMLLSYTYCENIPVVKVRDLLEKYGAKNCVDQINDFLH